MKYFTYRCTFQCTLQDTLPLFATFSRHIHLLRLQLCYRTCIKDKIIGLEFHSYIFYGDQFLFLKKKNKNLTLLALTLLGSSAAILPSSVAYAQEQQQSDILFAADDLSYKPDTGEVVATGNVHLQKGGYQLFAHKVLYNENTGVVEASGGVRMTSPNGEELIAPQITITNALRDAFIDDVRLIMKDGSQVAALHANRQGEEGITTLDRAVYSPCHVCEDKPNQKPLWQIKAVKVIHDEGKKRLRYKNAYLELFGVPIMWLPFFSHPDSQQARASGLLPIEVAQRKGLGFVFSLPYHVVIDESKDATITPIISTSEQPVLALEYRQHIGAGQYQVNMSGTSTGIPDYTTGIVGDKEFRGHIFAKGQFQHGKNWRSTVDLKYASDDTYLRRYGFTDLDTLPSELKMEGFLGRTYIAAQAIVFQGLRVEDIQGLTGYALPHLQVEYVPKFKPLGGTVYARFDALAINRTDGMDTQRISTSLEWNKQSILNNGIILETEALVRSDIYSISEANLPDDPAFAGIDGTTKRFLGHGSAKISYPMVRFGSNSVQTIEPIVEIVVAPNGGKPLGISNEDSRAFELNNINLFDADRSSGLDLWESGMRITYGLKWRYEGKDLNFSVMGGQSWRKESRFDLFVKGTGLEGHVSDFVGKLNIRYKDWLDIHHNFRLDKDSLTFKRNEASVIIGPKNARLNIGYLRLNRDLNFINREDREEIRLGGYYKLNDNWNFQALAISDLTSGAKGIEYGAGLNYTDECFDFGILYKRSYTRDRDIVPGSSIMFRLKLKNLG